MSRPLVDRNPRDRGLGGRIPGPIRALLLTALVLVVTFVAVQLRGNPDAGRDDDVPEVLAEGGCFDIEVEPVEDESPVSLSQAEAEVRAFLTEFDNEHDLPHELGSVRWAEYGKIVYGGYTDHPAPAVGQVRWVLIFESNKQHWWQRTFGRRLPNRRTALYVPEADAVSACSGLV